MNAARRAGGGAAGTLALAATLLPAILLLAVPGIVEGHGQSTTTGKDAGRYHVTFYTYEFITDSEEARFEWNVTDAATGVRLHVDNPRVLVAWFDKAGRQVNESTVPLQQRVDGFLFADFKVGPEGRMTFTLPLEGATVVFTQDVLPASTGGRANDAKPTPAEALPWVAGIVAGTAVAWARPRR